MKKRRVQLQQCFSIGSERYLLHSITRTTGNVSLLAIRAVRLLGVIAGSSSVEAAKFLLSSDSATSVINCIAR